jgi:hypothetical protein
MGQNVMISPMMLSTPRAVDIGIILGQYISQGTVTFCTNGSHRVRYNTIPTLAVIMTTEMFSIVLCNRIYSTREQQKQ